MLCTSLSPMQLKAAFTIALAVALIGGAQAQVVMVDKPFRQQAPASASPIDLSIAPYAPPVAAPAPVPQVVAPVAVPAKRWFVYAEDQTLSRALGRWAREEKLPFFWEAPMDIQAVPASYVGNYEAAMLGVMLDSPKSGYPLHACKYDNSIRVLHQSQPCVQ